MIKKFLSSQSNNITGAAIVLGGASFVSRLIGVIRDRILAHQFGASDVLDTYYAAFRIPDLVYNLLIVGALSAGFIPLFMHVYEKDKQEAWRVTNILIHVLFVSSLAICGVLFFAIPHLTELLAPGFSYEKIQTTILLTRIMLLSPIILGISGIISGVLQSMKCFFVYSLTPILYNLGIIIGALFLVPLFGVAGLAYGVIVGTLLHLAIQIPTLLHYGFRYKPQWKWKDPILKKMGHLMIPRTLTLATGQINLFIMTTLASTLPVGSITIFTFANNLQSFPIGIIGVSFALAAFPTLSKFVVENKKEEFVSHLSGTIRHILFFIIPITIIFLLLRAQIVRVVLGSGKFDWSATITTADALAFFSLSLFAQCLMPLFIRAFYSFHNTWTPFVIGFIGSLLNIIGSLIFKNMFGVPGLALAFSLAMLFQIVALWVSLRRHIGTLDESTILPSIYKMVSAAILMALGMQFLKAPIARMVDMTRFWGILTQGALVGLIGLGIYTGVSFLLRSQEMLELKESLTKRWLKLWNVQTEVRETNEI